MVTSRRVRWMCPALKTRRGSLLGSNGCRVHQVVKVDRARGLHGSHRAERMGKIVTARLLTLILYRCARQGGVHPRRPPQHRWHNARGRTRGHVRNFTGCRTTHGCVAISFALALPRANRTTRASRASSAKAFTSALHVMQSYLLHGRASCTPIRRTSELRLMRNLNATNAKTIRRLDEVNSRRRATAQSVSAHSMSARSASTRSS